MDRQEKAVPAAKAVTLVAFGVLIAIAALFFVGLTEATTILGKNNYGIKQVIDQIKVIAKDIGGYFKNLFETIKWMAKSFDHGHGLASLCMDVLNLIFPVVSIVFFAFFALKVVFSWTPFLKVRSIGWSRVCIRMCKKLKGAAACAIAYIVYCVTMSWGQSLSLMGEIAVYLIAAYAVLRIVLDSVGSDKVIGTVFRSVSAVAIAVFLVLVMKHLLDMDVPLSYTIFGYVEQAVVSMEGETENKDALFTFILFACSWLTVAISLGRVTAAMRKQLIIDKGGVNKSLVWLCIWLLVATALQFFATKKIYEGLSFSDWKDMEAAKYFMRAALYGVIALGLAIVTGILSSIGKKKSAD